MEVKYFGPDQVDAVVAGSGPAGLAATSELLSAGASVLMVDARKVIGTPIRCGELTRKKLFEVLGLEPQKGWLRWTLKRQGGALVVDRAKLELDFSRMLSHKGAFVSDSTTVVSVGEYDGEGRRVTIDTPAGQRDVAARCVIAADGTSSRVAQMCGVDTRLPLKKMGACYAYRLADVDLEAPYTYLLRYLKNMYPFYFWIIPSGAREANVGVVLPGDQGFRARRMLDEKLRSSKKIKGGKIKQHIIGCYPVAKPMETPYADGLMITGTAARMVDPRTGEGIWQAAVSGRLAAKTLLDAKDTTAESLALYREKLSELYENLLSKWAFPQESE